MLLLLQPRPHNPISCVDQLHVCWPCRRRRKGILSLQLHVAAGNIKGNHHAGLVGPVLSQEASAAVYFSAFAPLLLFLKSCSSSSASDRCWDAGTLL